MGHLSAQRDLTESVKTKITRGELDALRRLSVMGERSISATLRLAIREYLDRQEGEEEAA